MSDPKLEAAIAACKTQDELQNVLREYRASLGQPSMYDGHVLETQMPQPRAGSQPSVDVPKDDGRLLRKGVVLPDGRIQLIEAYSYAGLDFLEQALLKQR